METNFKVGRRFPTFVFLVLGILGLTHGHAAVTTYNFTYTNRLALLADGWDFLAKTAAGATRNTEVTNGGPNAVISYDQNDHPGCLRIPLDSGDLWMGLNNTRNSLFRTLPTNWTRVELDISFLPTSAYRQLNLALYRDDDNYIEIARTYGASVSIVRETNAVPNPETPVSSSIPDVALMTLRLDRDEEFGQISGYYSIDGSNWTFLAKYDQEFVAPRLCIWAGGAINGNPTADIKQLRITSSDSPINLELLLSTPSMVFNRTLGVANTNSQRINIYRRGPDAFNWTLTKNAAWLNVSTTNGATPSVCDVSVNTAGLTNGVYEAALTFTARGSITNTTVMPVTLILNATNRVSVATWKDGKKGAMTVWIDDSEPVMFDQLTAAGFKGTYALMGPGFQSAFLTTYFNSGMELGSHSETHPCTPLDGPERKFQITANLSNILASTPQTSDRLVSFAWPCGANTTRERAWASDYFIISRGYNWNQLEETTPRDFMDVKSYNSHEHPPFPPADFKTIVDAAIAQGKWANLSYHTMSNDDGSTAYAVGKDIWVGTGGDVMRYILQRDRTILTNYQTTGSAVSFNFRRLAVPSSPVRSFETSFNSNDSITFRISVTNLAPVAAVHVNGVSIPYTIRISGASTNLFFDALPQTNLQSVIVSLSNLPVLTVTPDPKTKVYRSPNPALTGSITGMTPGDGITATYSTTAANNSPVGNYPITPTFSDPLNRLGNYFVITNIGTLTITKSNAPITINNLNQTYSGTARTVTATTVPPSLTVNFTYNGNPSAPTNAGSYTVIGTISAANYQGSATNTLIVAKSNAPITLNNLSQIYNGTARTIGYSTTPNGLLADLTYNGNPSAPTNAGSYTVIGTINAANYQGSATNTLIVAKSNALISLSGLSQTYNGAAHAASYSTTPNGLVADLTYDGSPSAPTNAGSYVVIGNINDVNYQASATNTLVVAKSNAPITLADLSQTYSGAPRVATVVTTPSGLTVDLTYNGTSSAPTNAGSYTVIGTINDLNHQGSATNTLTVAKSNAPVSLGNLSQTYDGSARIVTATTTPSNLTMIFTYNSAPSAPTNAGSYTVIGTIDDLNHQGSATNTLIVTKSNAPVSLGNLSQTYDGSARIVTYFTTPSGLTVDLTYDGNTPPPTNAGSYTVIGNINELNHQGSATNTLVVAKSNSIVLLNDLNQIYDGTARIVTASTVPSSLTVDLTYDGNPSAPTNAGSYAVIGTILDLNHQGSTTNTLNIAKSNAPISLGDLSQTYNRTARTATASTTPPGLIVTFTYNGNAASPTNAGDYLVIGTVNDPNHQGSATNSMEILSSPLSVTISDTNRLVGGNNPTFAGILNGVFAGDDITLTLDSPATPASPIGSYPIIPTLVDPEGRLANYNFNLTNGVLSVVGQPQFTNITRTATGFVRLDCNVHPGRTYDFQFKDSLAETIWTTFASNQLASSALLVITNQTASTNLQRYYRAVDISVP